jgi:hypothetical protein
VLDGGTSEFFRQFCVMPVDCTHRCFASCVHAAAIVDYVSACLLHSFGVVADAVRAARASATCSTWPTTLRSFIRKSPMIIVSRASLIAFLTAAAVLLSAVCTQYSTADCDKY